MSNLILKAFEMTLLSALIFAVVASLISLVLILIMGGQTSVDTRDKLKEDMITHMYDEGLIDYDQYYEAMRMTTQAQQQFLQQQQELLTQMQLQELQNWQEQNMCDMDTAMRMSTGIEFGGYNPDPNLNPGMDFAQSMDFDPGPSFDMPDMWTGF